jgi:hypothetical protein
MNINFGKSCRSYEGQDKPIVQNDDVMTESVSFSLSHLQWPPRMAILTDIPQIPTATID